jgi:LacI family transcriptional regulator
VPDVTSAVFAELAAGASEAATERGLTLVLARAEQVTEDSDWIDRLLGEGRVDGMIVQLPDNAPHDIVARLARHAAPIVVINSIDDGPVDTIVLDDGAAVAAAVDHLVAIGHHELGFVGGLPGSVTGSRRRRAFIDRVRAHGLPVAGEGAPEQWVTDRGYGGADGRAAAVSLLAGPRIPTGVVVANLNAALGVLAEVHRSDFRVPGDISLIALHDVWYADALWPPLTTVRMPLRSLGSAAVEMLLESSRPSPVHRVIAEPPLVVVRESTAPPSRDRRN